MDDMRIDISLEDVLNELVSESEKPDPAIMAEYALRFPQYRQEIVDFSTAWQQMEMAPPGPELTPEESERLAEQGMQIVHKLLYPEETKPPRHVHFATVTPKGREATILGDPNMAPESLAALHELIDAVFERMERGESLKRQPEIEPLRACDRCGRMSKRGPSGDGGWLCPKCFFSVPCDVCGAPNTEWVVNDLHPEGGFWFCENCHEREEAEFAGRADDED